MQFLTILGAFLGTASAFALEAYRGIDGKGSATWGSVGCGICSSDPAEFL